MYPNNLHISGGILDFNKVAIQYALVDFAAMSASSKRDYVFDLLRPITTRELCRALKHSYDVKSPDYAISRYLLKLCPEIELTKDSSYDLQLKRSFLCTVRITDNDDFQFSVERENKDRVFRYTTVRKGDSLTVLKSDITEEKKMRELRHEAMESI